MRKLYEEINNIKLLLASNLTQNKTQVQNNVPYVSQFASPEYAEKVLLEGVLKTADPDWARTGADTPEEYARWVLVTCGMACAVMALRYFCDREYGTIALAKDALKHNVYKEQADALSSMHYREFVVWVESYGLQADVYSRLRKHGIHRLLSDGKLVIASVNPNIRGVDTVRQSQRGGHLVLVTGCDAATDTVTFHNPSGFVRNNSQINHTLSWQDFAKYFACRGIAISAL